MVFAEEDVSSVARFYGGYRGDFVVFTTEGGELRKILDELARSRTCGWALLDELARSRTCGWA